MAKKKVVCTPQHRLCVHKRGTTICDAQFRDDAGRTLWLCTRRARHSGPHVACTDGDDDDDHNLAVWYGGNRSRRRCRHAFKAVGETYVEGDYAEVYWCTKCGMLRHKIYGACGYNYKRIKPGVTND